MATERRPRPETADEMREMCGVTQGRWESTLAQAHGLPEDAVQERVGDEWSLVETLRHLVFVHDAWVARALLGETAYHPLGLPPTAMKSRPPLPGDPAAHPSLDAVLSLRSPRTARAAAVLGDLTDDALEEQRRVTGPGYPRPGRYPARRFVLALLTEEWEHQRYAARDLAVVAARLSGS
jgi:uncharacterized damage-inducible protein DinB